MEERGLSPSDALLLAPDSPGRPYRPHWITPQDSSGGSLESQYQDNAGVYSMDYGENPRYRKEAKGRGRISKSSSDQTANDVSLTIVGKSRDKRQKLYSLLDTKAKFPDSKLPAPTFGGLIDYVRDNPGKLSKQITHIGSGLREEYNIANYESISKQRVDLLLEQKRLELEQERLKLEQERLKLELQKRKIANYYRGYQENLHPKEIREAFRWQCTLGCSWSHKSKSNWERHELTHYPQRIWICFHDTCLGKSPKIRVSFRKDLARRHYADHHRSIRGSDLSDRQPDELVVKVEDSLFPRKCVFDGCIKTFKDFWDRSTHIETHLKNEDRLCREKIKKNFVDADVEVETEEDRVLSEVDMFDDEFDVYFDDDDDDDESVSSDKDARSTYSYVALTDSDQIANQSAVVHLLFDSVPFHQIDRGSPKHLDEWLQETLRLFALQLGQVAKKQKEYDTMLFILKYRREIAAELQDQWQIRERSGGQSDSNQISRSKYTGQRQVDQAKDRPTTAQDDERLHLSDSEGQSTGNPFIEILQEDCSLELRFVTSSPAYAWLISRLTTHSYLTVPENDIMTCIEQTIYNCFLGYCHINRETPNLPHTVSFKMNLDLSEFFNSHDFGDLKEPAAILHSFLTLTSDGKHVQTLTCLQYLRQVWPQSGEIFLELITKVARKGSVSLNLPGRTVDGWISNGKTIFNVTGSLHLISELGQQLAWIGSALRSSGVEGKVRYCVPIIGKAQVDLSVPFLGTRRSYSCNINFKVFEDAKIDRNAECWHALFRYPLIAQGFPVARRDDGIEGLEIRLGAMLSLCHAHHLSDFEDKILIKGHSAMFWLSKHRSGSSVWHFSGHINGPYISCSEIANAYEDKTLSVHEILQDRHFVGWCSEFTYNAGAFKNCYAIQASGLSHAEYGGVLFETNIRRPVRYPDEAVCIVDNKENKWRTPGQSYRERLEWIHKRPVVLWDTEHRKGWLLNGTSALLHLIFASVEDRGGPFDSTYCLRREDIRQYPEQPENAAARLLLDENNLKLPIRRYGEEVVCLKQRVEDMSISLNLVIEIQISRIRNNKTVTRSLDGWDFMDVADITHDPLHARTFELNKDCSGWMYLLQDTCSVTLFGENFGEILSPVNSSLCHGCSTLPPQNCFLAASIDDLDLISRTYGGNKRVVPRKLTENTTWAITMDKFDNCKCSENRTEHSNLVQVLVPRSRFKDYPIAKDLLCIGPSAGAVIFGQVDCTAWVRSNGSFLSDSRPLKRQRHDGDTELQNGGVDGSISDPTLTQNSKSPKHEEYLIAIVCALRKELRAVRLLFDQTYKDPAFDKHDRHHYAFGRIHSHKVVAACLPGVYGTCSATHVASELQRSFPMVKFCLLVGVGAGIPSEKNDIRLGDVVVSYPEGDHSGMIKYDFEKLIQSGQTKRLGTFIQPPRELISALGILDTGPVRYIEPLMEYLKVIVDAEDDYRYPGEEMDRLFAPDSPHILGMTSCDSCTGLQQRKLPKPRRSQQPRIHYGLIASGDKVVKDAHMRDMLGSRYNALCIEMEAAGVANVLPCLVIRGICDYADSHKHDIWQEYASATAAAYAKLLLGKARIA